MKYKKSVWSGLVLAILAASVAWVYATGSGRIDQASAAPAYVVVNTPTQVTFTARISDSKSERYEREKVLLVRTDASGTPIDIVGRMLDSGKRGDANRKDSVYSIKVSVNEPVVGPIYFRIAARFKSTTGFDRRGAEDDNDWDKDLQALNDPKARGKRHDRLPPLLRKLQQYTLSDLIQLTIDPIALPPDPGEAGVQTLEGVDTDADGVRDDVQRFIAIGYSSGVTRAALSQLARALQQSITATDSPEMFDLARRARFRSIDCLYYVDPVNAYALRTDLISAAANTRERLVAYIHAGNQPGESPYPLPPGDEKRLTCDFDPSSVGQ